MFVGVSTLFVTIIHARRRQRIPHALFEIAEKENIAVRWWKFVPPIQAVYWAPPDFPPLIGLNWSLSRCTRLLRSVLAEELGHHFTSAGVFVARPHLSYAERLWVSKEERRAFKWAALYLMPEKKLTWALRSGFVEIWELAEYFGVTEEMVRFRLGINGTFFQVEQSSFQKIIIG